MLDRRKHPRHMHVLYVRIGAELHTQKAQGHFSFDGPAKTFCDEIRRDNPVVVDRVARAAQKSRSMKNVVAQLNVASCEAARSFVSAVRERSLSAHVDVAGRHLRRTKRLAEVEQFDPTPVTETPFRFCEVGHFRLEIKMRPSGAQHPLLECESVTPNRKFRREICGHRRHILGAKSYVLPFEIPEIQGMLG